MSKPTLPKSVISADFDGEVSAEERAAVSRAAQKSPAVQQMLDDYAQLSQSLQALHRDVPSPGLRDAVLNEIQSSIEPQVQLALPLLSRRWVQITGGVLAVAAAGLLLMIRPAGPQPDNRAVIAMNDSKTTEEPSGPALAAGEGTFERARDDTVPAPPSRVTESAVTDALAAPVDAPAAAASALADRSVKEDPERMASIPEDWLTPQVAKNHRIPQPGDVVRYLDRVADETVWITVTVVDVQMTAGEIRLLLARHGIESPGNGSALAAWSTEESNMAILVESDWGRVSDVMDDLDTQGYGVARNVEDSPAAQQAMMAQNSIGPLDRIVASETRKARTDLPSAPLSARKRRAESELLARDNEADNKSAASEKDIKEALPKMFHAQWLTPVSDEFVEKVEQRQQAAALEAGLPELAASSATERQPGERESSDSDGVRKRKPWDFYTTRAPARVVILIRKSGSNP